MFKHVKVGDSELIEQVEILKSTREILWEVLSQNRMILEANCAVMRMIGQPMMFIAKVDDQAK